MNPIRRDELLQEFLIHEGSDMVKFKKLSEQEKNVLSRDMVDAMFTQIASKYNNTDFDVIEASKGDIEKLKGYNDIKLSITALKELRYRTNTQLSELDIIESAIKNLTDYKKQWEMGFKLNKGIVIMMYNSIVAASICSLSYLISSGLEYVTSIDGTYDIKLKEHNDRNFSYPTVFIKNLESFNKVALNGELAKFFEVAYSKQGFAAVASPALMLGGVSIIAIIGVSLSIIPIIREIIYQFYFMRVSISEHLRVQSSYLELNQNKLMSMKNGKDSAKKQKNIADNLIKMADKIDVDQKSASKKAEMEIKKENKKININDVAIDSSVTSSYGNIL